MSSYLLSQPRPFRAQSKVVRDTHQDNAVAMWASLNTIAGDFPPNSRTHRLRLLLAAASWTLRPAVTDPVKLIWAMPISEASSLPVSTEPERKFITPGGKPALPTNRPSASAPKGAFSEALKMHYWQKLDRQLSAVCKGFYRIPSSECGSQFQGHVPN
jgi:hypothetical protein